MIIDTWITCFSSTFSKAPKLKKGTQMKNHAQKQNKKYVLCSGFAAARILVFAFKVAWIPALDKVIVCCSIASWIADWSFGSILSNSSMQQMPPFASINAPGSITFVSWSIAVIRLFTGTWYHMFLKQYERSICLLAPLWSLIDVWINKEVKTVPCHSLQGLWWHSRSNRQQLTSFH